jgi:hypothetical protein
MVVGKARETCRVALLTMSKVLRADCDPYPGDERRKLPSKKQQEEKRRGTIIATGEGWLLAGTYCGRAGVAGLLQKASEMLETSFLEPREFVGQGDRVLVVGFERGRVKATNRTFEGHWVTALYRPEWQSDERPGV